MATQPQTNPATLENLTKARQGAAMLRDDLLQAIKTASAIEALPIQHAITEACRLENRVAAILLAVGSPE